MYPRSSKFDIAWKHSHRTCARVAVYDQSGRVVLDTEDGWLSPIDGEVTATSDSVRRVATITLLGSLSDQEHEWLRAPGMEWRLWRGIEYPDGTKEWGQLGTLYYAEHADDDSGKSQRHRVQLADGALQLSERRLTVPFSYNGDPVSGVLNMLRNRNPDLRFGGAETSNTGSSRALFFDVQSDPWAKTLEVLRDHGMEAFFDVKGQLISRPVGDATRDVPVWHFIDGTNCNFYNLQVTTGRRRYNHVVVTGEPAGLPPVEGHAYDLDPTNPANYATGDVPYFIRSDLVTSVAQATTVAETFLSKMLGKRDTIVISCAVNPFFDVGDVVRFQRANMDPGSHYIIDRLSWPMSALRPMYITMRRSSGQ